MAFRLREFLAYILVVLTCAFMGFYWGVYFYVMVCGRGK